MRSVWWSTGRRRCNREARGGEKKEEEGKGGREGETMVKKVGQEDDGEGKRRSEWKFDILEKIKQS